MKMKQILCCLLGICISLSVTAQSSNILTIFDEYNDTLKSPLVEYKLKHEGNNAFKDCNYDSLGRVHLYHLREGVYTLRIEQKCLRDIQIPLEKDTLVVNLHPQSIFEAGEPSHIITAEQLAISGKNTLEEALVYLLPSFYASWQIIADKSEMFTPTSMKGMGPDQFLVLINGKRRHSTSILHLNGTFGRGTVSNDLVNIPLNAVKAIEIKNAAACVWHGSDAIAGVINIQLHDKPIPSVVGLQGGFYPSGFGNGQWWDPNNARKFLQFGNETEGKLYLQSFHYLDKAQKGFLSLNADFIYLGHINRSENYQGDIFKQGDKIMVTPKDSIAFWNYLHNNVGFKDKKVLMAGRAAIEQATAYFNLETPINKAYFYAFGGVSYKIGDIIGLYTFPKSEAAGTINPTATPYGYSTHLTPKSSDYYLTAGAKLKIGVLGNLDLSHSIGAQAVHNYLDNSFNVDLSHVAPFNNVVPSPTNFYAGSNYYRQQTTDIQLHKLYPIQKGWTHFETTIGLTLRTETFGTVAGEPSAYYFTPNDYTKHQSSTQKLPSFHPDDVIERERNNYAAFTQIKWVNRDTFYHYYYDTLHQLVWDTLHFINHLTMGGRFETFTNYYGYPIFKIAGSHTYLGTQNELEVRLSWNQGIRTPSLHQIYFSGLSAQYKEATGEPSLVYIASNESILARAFEVQQLKPEKAQTWNIGGSWRNKANQLELKIDYSNTIVYNRIIFSSFEDDTNKIFDVSKRFELHLKDRDVTSVLFFKNLPTTTTQNVDISVQWKRNTAQWLLGFNWNQTKLATTTRLGQKIFTGLDRQETSRYESIIPNFKGFILLHGRSKKISYKLQTTIFGQNAFIAPLNAISNGSDTTKTIIKTADQVFNNQNEPIIDIEFSYHVNSKSKITIGCNNIWGFKSNKVQEWDDVKKRIDLNYPGLLTQRPDLEELWDANITRYKTLKYSDQVQTFGVGGRFIYTRFTYNLF
jgi:iron complex outermembrane recepter protein